MSEYLDKAWLKPRFPRCSSKNKLFNLMKGDEIRVLRQPKKAMPHAAKLIH
jgi:hypothetical protein